VFLAIDSEFTIDLSLMVESVKVRRFKVRRSRLESCEDILEAVLVKPLSIDGIAFETDMECSVLKKHLDFMLENGLVTERPVGKQAKYAVTDRGVAVLKALNFQKYLAKVADKIMVMDEAFQIISKDGQKLEKEDDDE
jgi:predicted transcriptional regulator